MRFRQRFISGWYKGYVVFFCCVLFLAVGFSLFRCSLLLLAQQDSKDANSNCLVRRDETTFVKQTKTTVTILVFLCLGVVFVAPPNKKRGGSTSQTKILEKNITFDRHPPVFNNPLSSQLPIRPGSHKAQRSLFSYPKLPSWERITYPTYPLPSLYHDFPNFPFGWDMWSFPS